MNGNKFEEIQRKIFSMKYIERIARESAKEVRASVDSVESEIQKRIQEIEQERRIIDRDISATKTLTNTTLETVSFSDPLPEESKKILAQQSEILRQIVAEQIMLEKNLDERKSAFAKKKAELHKKFLQNKIKRAAMKS